MKIIYNTCFQEEFKATNFLYSRVLSVGHTAFQGGHAKLLRGHRMMKIIGSRNF
jgi:hypothetical protein